MALSSYFQGVFSIVIELSQRKQAAATELSSTQHCFIPALADLSQNFARTVFCAVGIFNVCMPQFLVFHLV